MSLIDVLTIAALLLGPISAVLITRFVDDRSARRTRRMDVFRTLMRTRRNQMSADYVGALNLVEIEFANDPQVLARWRALFTHFGTTQVRRENEAILPGFDATETKIRNERFGSRLATERQTLLAKLLSAMARSLKFSAEQLEILEGGYTPQGWAEVEDEQNQLRRYFLGLLKGDLAMPVMVFPPPDARPAPDAAENADRKPPAGQEDYTGPALVAPPKEVG